MRSVIDPTAQKATGGPLLDYDGAAKYLRTTRRHVRELWQRREIGAVKVGKLVRFTQEDLDAYIRLQRQPSVKLGSAH